MQVAKHEMIRYHAPADMLTTISAQAPTFAWHVMMVSSTQPFQSSALTVTVHVIAYELIRRYVWSVALMNFWTLIHSLELLLVTQIPKLKLKMLNWIIGLSAGRSITM